VITRNQMLVRRAVEIERLASRLRVASSANLDMRFKLLFELRDKVEEAMKIAREYDQEWPVDRSCDD